MRRYILFFFFFSQFLSAQLEIQYRVYHRIDSLMSQDTVNPYDAKLFILNDKTVYASNARIQSDSLRIQLRKSMDFSVLSVSKKKGFQNEYITADLKNKTIAQHARINDKSFRFDSKADVQWKSEPTTKRIGPYLARKATGILSGRHYTVWYTTEIPIPAGPFKFFGLPGFVLEAEDDTKDIRFELVSVKKLTTGLEEVLIENHNEKSIKDYQEYLHVFKSSMHARPGQELYNFADQESRKRLDDNHAAKVRKYNNFIER